MRTYSTPGGLGTIDHEVVAAVMDKWTDEHVRAFAEGIIGDDIAKMEQEVLAATARAAGAEADRASADTRWIESQQDVAYLREKLEVEEMKRHEAEDKLGKIRQQFESTDNRRHELELEVQKTRSSVPAEANELADIISGITPDRRCNTCHGRHGWYGLEAVVNLKDQTKTIKLFRCCGTVGNSEYQRLQIMIRNMEARAMGREQLMMTILRTIREGTLINRVRKLLSLDKSATPSAAVTPGSPSGQEGDDLDRV